MLMVRRNVATGSSPSLSGTVAITSTMSSAEFFSVVAGKNRGPFGPLVEVGVEILEQERHPGTAGPDQIHDDQAAGDIRPDGKGAEVQGPQVIFHQPAQGEPDHAALRVGFQQGRAHDGDQGDPGKRE